MTPRLLRHPALVTGLGLLLLGFCLGALWQMRDTPAAASSAPPPPPSGQTSAGNWFKGSAQAPIEITLYGDYACAHCVEVEQALAQGGFEQHYIATGLVRYVYIDVPIVALHPSADDAAATARCAGEQQRFWEVHGALLAASAAWRDDSQAAGHLRAIALAAGVQAPEFDACLARREHLAFVLHSAEAAQAQGVPGTPLLLVNGQPVTWTGQPASDVFSAIERERARLRSGQTEG